MKTEIGRCKDVITGKVYKYHSLDMNIFKVGNVDYIRNDFDEKFDIVDYVYENTDSGVSVKLNPDGVTISKKYKNE